MEGVRGEKENFGRNVRNKLVSFMGDDEMLVLSIGLERIKKRGTS